MKSGITDNRKKDEESSKKSVVDEVFEPFSYPPLKESVGHMLTDGLSARVNYTGEKITTRGRRFGYSEQEFLEAYLGKDYARKIDLNDNHDNLIFGFQESLKEQVPDKEKYLKLPQVLRDQERLEEAMGTYKVDGRAKDHEFAQYLKTVDKDALNDQAIAQLDVPHHSDPNRSFTKDLMQMIGDIQTKMKNSSTPTAYNRRDVFNALEKLNKEYTGDDLMNDEKALETLAAQWGSLCEPYEEELKR